MEIGPLQLLVVGFPEADFKGEILDEINNLRQAELIKVVDLLGVYKSLEGEVVVAEMSDLSLDESAVYGAFVGGFIGLGATGDVEGFDEGALAGALLATEQYDYGMDREALAEIVDDIPPGGGALLAVIEHRWAIPFRDAVRGAGGIMVAQDFLSPETLMAVGAGLSRALDY